MLNKNIYEVIQNEVKSARDSDNPELAERLNLANLILDETFISPTILEEYINWAKEQGKSQNILGQLFSKYILACRSDGSEQGIFPFIKKILNELEEICSLQDYSNFKVPSDKIVKIETEISEISKKMAEYNDRIALLQTDIEELEALKRQLADRESTLSKSIEEFDALKGETSRLKRKLDDFEKEISETTIDDIRKENEKIRSQYDEAKKAFLATKDLENYYSALLKINLECEAIEKIRKYRRILAEVSEDLSIFEEQKDAQIDIYLAALESAAIKIEPFYQALREELKQVIEKLDFS